MDWKLTPPENPKKQPKEEQLKLFSVPVPFPTDGIKGLDKKDLALWEWANTFEVNRQQGDLFSNPEE